MQEQIITENHRFCKISSRSRRLFHRFFPLVVRLPKWRKVVFTTQRSRFPDFKSRVLHCLRCPTTDMRETISGLLPTLLILRISSIMAVSPSCPQEIHLSLGNAPQDLVVTWVTFTPTEKSYVLFWKITEGVTSRAEGVCEEFSSGKIVRYIHRVVLPGLQPRTSYGYRCGSSSGESQNFAFKTNPAGSNWSPQLIVYGDMGWQGAVAFPYILQKAIFSEINAVVHVGDIAYNLASSDGMVGDMFLRMIEPLAGSVPYMTAVGNHEQFLNFSHYKALFSMPGNSQGYFYSFDMGPAHFVVISTEVYYFQEYGLEPVINQFEWLQNDLKKAADERNVRPWIIVFGHRPLYCSSDTGEDCSRRNSILRHNYIQYCNYGLENLFYAFDVDVIFSGHMHYYERSWPIYNSEVYNGSLTYPYTNPGAPIHIITGAPGMVSGTESVHFIRQDLFAFFSNEYSYSLLTIHNKTHLSLEQISATRYGETIDTMTVTKDDR